MGAVHGVVLKYVAVCAAAIGGALAWWERPHLALPLCFVAASNALVIFLFWIDRGARLIGKDAKTGALPWLSIVIWSGFLGPTWLYTRIHTLLGREFVGVPEATEVVDGWWLGSRYADCAGGIPERWSGVLDLTCELPERCFDAADDYKLVAVWDGAPPPPREIEDAARWLVAARDNGPVLVHCAHGRGRSTTVMCAALVRAGLFESWPDAFAACQIKRPGVKLNARMRAALEGWSALTAQTTGAPKKERSPS